MNILITGGAGFIGSHVVDAYIAAGHEVWVLDDLSQGKRENVNRRARLVQMDVRSLALKDLFAEFQFDCVNHHAAQINARASVADPCHDARVNIDGTLNLLEAMRAHRVGRIIFSSTGGAIYGNQSRYPTVESHSTVPISPYGVAKLAVEQYLECYRQIHGLKYVVLRYANVYGPRQDPRGEAGVMAIFCTRILEGNGLIVYGDGCQTRDYVYVGDVAEANAKALSYLEQHPNSTNPKDLNRLNRLNEHNGLNRLNRLNGLNNSTDSNSRPIFNIGTGIETSVNALAALMLQAADIDCPVVHQSPRPGEQPRSVIDPSMARQVLGWAPAVSLTDGLIATLTWFRSRDEISGQQSTSPPVLDC